MNPGAEEGAIPVNELVNMRPTVMAGLAKLVDEVKKYAAVMYDATPTGTIAVLPDRISPKIKRTKMAVARISEEK